MKKTMSSALALLLMLLTFVNCLGASAKGEFEFKKLNDGTISITSYNGGGKNVVIPDEIDGKTVSAVAESAFSNNKTIESVKIGSEVETIEKNAFNNCINLKSVVFPFGLKEIGENAFFTCTSLGDVEFPQELEKIGAGGFYGCNSFKKVVLPSGLKAVGDYAFSACTNLESVVISEGLERISNQMFFSCENLKSAVLPESVKVIGRRAFATDRNLASVKLPEKLDLIDDSAFSACFNLSISKVNAKEIRDYAFHSAAFDSVDLGKDVEKIGDNVFSSGEFESVYIPASVKELTSKSFGSETFGRITVDEDNPYYEDIDGVLFSKDGETLIKYPNARGEDDSVYEIPTGVKEISKAAFNAASELSGVIIPDTVEKIGDGCFEYCSQLESITVPNSVTYIGKTAFSSCSSLVSATLPDELEEIEERTFSECYALKDVTIGEGTEKIGNEAFSFCGELESITIPKSVTEFNTSTFSQCYSLKNINLEEGSNLVMLDGTVMNSEKTKLLAYFGEEENYNVPDGIKSIGELAIMPNSTQTVTIPESVETFGKYAVGYILSYGSNPYEALKWLKIFGKEGSAAQNYAKENSIAFYTCNPQANAESIELKAGESFEFSVNGAVLENTEFASSNTAIASVDRTGKVTGVKNGTADIFAVIGEDYFKLTVTVTGGEDYVDPFSSYRTVKNTEIENWSKDYLSYNGVTPFSVNEYYNTYLYTTELYVPIMAHMVGGTYEELAKESYGEDYGQYKQVGDNLSDELSRARLHENTVLFSGTDDISYITHSGSSITDMVSSIGTTHTYDGVVSTSLAHGVAAGFGTGMTHTMLEIYADKDSTDGVYIAGISCHPDEYELLLTNGLKYKVIDAGIRTTVITNRYSGEPEEVTERFIKLCIVHDEPKEEESSFETMLNAFFRMLRSIYSLIEVVMKLICRVVG